MLNQPERKPDYFIQIPPEVLFETKLSAGAKLFYGEVLFLTYTYGFCSQKNAYFAANHGVSLRTVENWIKELKALNLIKVELIRKQNKEVELRKIFALAKIDFSKMPGINQISVQAEAYTSARITKSSPKDNCGLKRSYHFLEIEKKLNLPEMNFFYLVNPLLISMIQNVVVRLKSILIQKLLLLENNY